ncbi:MAG: hypothetical protein ACE5I2_13805, partial [Anaerolineae bacterium]
MKAQKAGRLPHRPAFYFRCTGTLRRHEKDDQSLPYRKMLKIFLDAMPGGVGGGLGAGGVAQLGQDVA